MTFDIVIRNGHVIDGSGTPRIRADVGISADRITSIGDLASASAPTQIDAHGKIVAPGFIDLHNHADGWLLRSPHVLPKTSQGFTTEVIMSDGISYAPVDEFNWRDWFFYLRSLDSLRVDEYLGWKSLADYQQCLNGRSVQNNLLQVPYGNVRALVAGFGPKPLDDLQRKLIQSEIRSGLETGAAALSTGLDYLGQLHVTTDDLVHACSILKEYDALYVTHVRYKLGLLPAVEEAVEIARRSGCRLHISHLKAQGPDFIEPLLELIDKSRKEVDLSFDCYPYLPGSTMLNFLLPYEVWDDGPLAALGKLNDPRIRSRFRRALDNYRLPLDKLHIAWVPGKENSQHQGKLLSQYIAETGLSPEDALMNLLIEERLSVLLVFHEGDDPWCWPMLQHDCCLIGTDAIEQENGNVHPRMFGSANRLLGPLVRDQRLFTLEEIIAKLSGRSATRFQIPNRGFIRENHFADVVVFDPETIIDRATLTNPRQLSTGIEHVLVNGRSIIRDSQPLDIPPNQLPGRSLKIAPAH